MTPRARSIQRRDFLRAAGLAPAVLTQGRLLAQAPKAPAWRTFEVTTRIEVVKPNGPTRIWAPVALIRDTAYQRTRSNTFHCETGTAKTIETAPASLGIVAAEFPSGAKPVLTVTSRVSTRDWAVDLSARPVVFKVNPAELKYFLRPTKLIPTDGLVKETAMKITGNAKTDSDKARAIYEWIVENTRRDPKVRGCGRGDIRFMLESRDLAGKCADLNALYVGLARAAGLPARDVYGIRVAKSELGYKSLGAALGSRHQGAALPR